MSGLGTLLEDAKASCKKQATKNEKLQTQIDEVKSTASKVADSTAQAIGQLERDLEEEFQIATKFKRDIEELKKKSTKEKAESYTEDFEDLLSSLRMIQCWQLSH